VGGGWCSSDAHQKKQADWDAGSRIVIKAVLSFPENAEKCIVAYFDFIWQIVSSR
jgi:hypothetical protein